MSRNKSDSLWYARYPGDFMRKTQHLSLAEVGAYDRLMDWCYANSRALPLDILQLHRICNALATDEQRAVDNILHQFFKKSADGWINKRVIEELEKRKKISEKRVSAQAASVAARRANKEIANAIALANTSTSRVSERKDSRTYQSGAKTSFKKIGELVEGNGKGGFEIRDHLTDEDLRELLRLCPEHDRNFLMDNYNDYCAEKKFVPAHPKANFFARLRKYFVGKKP